MLFNIPPPRYTVVSPYTSQLFTKFQLDMRRKAEILQHNSVQKSTQTNSLTKAQRFAQIVRSPPPLSSVAVSEMNCPTWTSSSNVPGPRMQLYMDTSVPLYNFATAARAYGILTLDNTAPWRIYKSTDTFTYLANESTFLAAIEILDPIDTPFLLFSLSIPSAIPYKIQVFYSESVVFESNATGTVEIPLKTAAGYFYEIYLTFTDNSVVDMSKVTITAT